MAIYNLNDGIDFDDYINNDQDDAISILDYLAELVVGKRCCAFVGAGVSMRSGLPNWTDFIQYMRGKYVPEKFKDADFIDKYIERKDLITAAELIKRSNSIRRDFNVIASDFFQTSTFYTNDNVSQGDTDIQPDDCHRFITRIHFHKIITTNYDNLLNKSSEHSNVIAHTQLTRNAYNFETQDSIRGLMSDSPAIVKIHGTCTEPETMIITRKDYLDAYSGGYLNNWLRTSLTEKNFLFVGYSLTDFEIVNLIKEAKAKLPNKVVFGPHFAILDRSESPHILIQSLEDNYGIKTIRDNIRGKENKHILRRMFACIHGLCASKYAKMSTRGNQLYPSLKHSLTSICRSLQEHVGVDYISLYLSKEVDDTSIGKALSLISGRMKYDINTVNFGSLQPAPEGLKQLFLNMRDCNYYYSGEASDNEIREFGIENIGGLTAKSILIVPVSSQGKKIGLLVMGSVIEGAFTTYHYDAVLMHAKSVAESCNIYFEKIRIVNKAAAALHYNDALAMMKKSRLLNSLLRNNDFDCLVYQVDYAAGVLLPHYNKQHIDNNKNRAWPVISLQDDYLVCQTIGRGSTLLFKNKEEALSYAKGNDKAQAGLEYFNVHGNLYMTPIRSNGHVSAVMVCWDNAISNRKRYTPFERAKRIMRLLMNSFIRNQTGDKPAIEFIKKVDSNFAKFDKGDNMYWYNAVEKNDIKAMDSLILSALRTLISPLTQLTRARIWMIEDEKLPLNQHFPLPSTKFVIKKSFSCQTALRKNHKKQIDLYTGIESISDDIYAKSTLERFRTDPYSRIFDPKKSSVTDLKWKELDKDEYGSWYNVPLVFRPIEESDRTLKLIGFISVDDHKYIPKLRKYKQPDGTSPELRAFQRCAIDLIAHMISPLLMHRYFR